MMELSNSNFGINTLTDIGKKELFTFSMTQIRMLIFVSLCIVSTDSVILFVLIGLCVDSHVNMK